MSSTSIKPQNLPETLVWYYLIGTYGVYLIGAQSILAPLLGCFLTAYLLNKWWHQTEDTPPQERISISVSTWVWAIAMLVIAIALVAGHLDFSLGLSKIVKSSVNGWLRQWALLALFPLVGHLNIRPQLIYRGVCIVCLQSLMLMPVLYLAGALHLPAHLYTSPLGVFGGGFDYGVSLYTFKENSQEMRLALFAPWSPALGLVSNIYFFLASQEADRKWRWIGMIGSVAMIVTSVSRLAMLCLPFVLGVTWLLVNLVRPSTQFAIGLGCLTAGLWSSTLLNFIQTSQERIYQARRSSSRVRATLGRMAIDRWDEAPVWGHGIVETRGPKVVEHMPIGSHHTWFGLLFTHGIVGSIALAVAFAWSFVDLSIKAQSSQVARVGFSIVLSLLVFTIGENISVLAYICWPGLVLVGIAYQEQGIWHQNRAIADSRS